MRHQYHDQSQLSIIRCLGARPRGNSPCSSVGGLVRLLPRVKPPSTSCEGDVRGRVLTGLVGAVPNQARLLQGPRHRSGLMLNHLHRRALAIRSEAVHSRTAAPNA